MRIDYLFSRNDKYGSRAIAWASKYERLGLDKLPSHVAVLIDRKYVIESTLFTGIRIAPYFKWKKINEELYRVPCTSNHTRAHVHKALLENWGKKYDWGAIAYFMVMFVRLIMFKKEMPSNNLWQDRDKFMCTEFVAKLTGDNYSMVTPARLCKKLLDSNKEDV